MELLILAIFIIGYLLIAFEHNIGMNKTKGALFFGTLSWIIIFIYASQIGDLKHSEHLLDETFLEIIKLSLFLISAMTIVAYLTERKVLEKLAHKIILKKIKKTNLLFIIGIFTFLFSSIADNLTAALVSTTILLTLKELKEKEIILFIIFIIFAANVGGVALITGDVTTLMIFLSGKVNIVDLLFLFIPSFIAFLSLFFLLKRQLKGSIEIKKNNYEVKTIDKIIFSIFIGTIIFIIVGHVLFHIPPSLIFLFGLSLIFIISWFYKNRKRGDLKILGYLHKVEFDAIFFFIGILLMVASLDYFNLLSKIGELFKIIPEELAIFIIGILSSIFDNIPLTAAMIKSNIPIGESSWLNLTYAVGSGGSLLIIGSAAGIIAMSKYKEITFSKYLKYFHYIFISYSIGFVFTILITKFI